MAFVDISEAQKRREALAGRSQEIALNQISQAIPMFFQAKEDKENKEKKEERFNRAEAREDKKLLNAQEREDAKIRREQSKALQKQEEDRQKEISNLRKEVSGLGPTKDAQKVEAAFGKIKAAADQKNAPGDQALIFNFMKILDPGSTVREGEFATVENSRGVPDTIRNLNNKLLKGTRLTDTQRRELLGTAGGQARAQIETFNKSLEPQIRFAKERGLPSEQIFPTISIPDLEQPQEEQIARPSIFERIQAPIQSQADELPLPLPSPQPRPQQKSREENKQRLRRSLGR